MSDIMNMQISVESIWNEPGGCVHCDLLIDIPPFHLRGVLMKVMEGSTVALDVCRTGEGWYLTGRGEAAVAGRCSRCLGAVQMTIPVDFSVEIRDETRGDRGEEPPSDEVIPRMTRDGRIEVGERVREEIILGIPLKILCDPDCRGLCPVCGVNLNETTCDCEPEPGDPRLAALQKLKEKMIEG
ncbi:MAG: DUF177 domain-containing protein [Bacillota bacterium]